MNVVQFSSHVPLLSPRLVFISPNVAMIASIIPVANTYFFIFFLHVVVLPRVLYEQYFVETIYKCVWNWRAFWFQNMKPLGIYTKKKYINQKKQLTIVISISTTHQIVSIIICFIALTSIIANVYAEEISQDSQIDGTCPNENNTNKTCNNKSLIPLKGNQLIYVIFGLVIIIIISLIGITYGIKRQFLKTQASLLQPQTIEKEGEYSEQQPDSPPYKEVMTKMLSEDENRILKELINQNGSLLQSHISRMPNMGKVKAHRILKELKKKEIVTIRANGKTNEISLTDEIKTMVLS